MERKKKKMGRLNKYREEERLNTGNKSEDLARFGS